MRWAMMNETSGNWLCFLDQNGYHTFLVLVEEEPTRRAYALYREGRVLEAARALKEATAVAYEVDEELWDRLYEAVPDMAWRTRGAPLSEDQVINERPGEAFILLRGEPYEEAKMPVAVLSGIGWDHGGRTEFHYTLVVDEELLRTEPIEELPECEEVSE
jgi:hypothetical protein